MLQPRGAVFPPPATEDVERIFGKRKKDILRERKEAEAKAAGNAADVPGAAPASSVAAQSPEPSAASAVAQTAAEEAPAGSTAAASAEPE